MFLNNLKEETYYFFLLFIIPTCINSLSYFLTQGRGHCRQNKENVIPLDDGSNGKILSQLANHGFFNCRVCKLRNIPSCALDTHIQSNEHDERMSEYTEGNPMSLKEYFDYSACKNTLNPSFSEENQRSLIGVDAIIGIFRADRVCYMCYPCKMKHICGGDIIAHLLSPSHIFRYMVENCNSMIIK